MYRFGNIIDAVRDFKVAEYISERSDDEELKSQVYQLLAHVNYYFRNPPSILKYSQKLLDSSTELHDSTMMVKSLLMCATAHADDGERYERRWDGTALMFCNRFVISAIIRNFAAS